METSSASPVLIKEREGPILIARMNRPERLNALGGGLPEALQETYFEFRDNASLKVLILTGTGDRAFCVGADLRRNAERFSELGASSGQALLDANRAPVIQPSLTGNNLGIYKPIIAAINGWCLAAGCEMAMGCDLRIIEEHAQIGLPEVKRGMGAKHTTHKLSFLTPLSTGLELVWTGDPLDAQRALELGFVNDVVPTGQSLERAKQIARSMSEMPLTYLRYQKERLFQSIGVPLAFAISAGQRLHDS